MINEIGGYSSNLSTMQAMRSRQGPGEMFNKVDTDDSGGISQSEFERIASHIAEKTGNIIATENAITTYDSDGNGELGKDELKSFMHDNGIKPPPPPQGTNAMEGIGNIYSSSTSSESSISSEYDTNGDGVISYDELQQYLGNTETDSLKLKMNQAAISAYTRNYENNQFSNNADILLNSGEDNKYSVFDVTA